ncbi:MarR family winged helix-turn-helix transcriptional regulator [Streptomyces harbinensis]|uniref:MarR family winged helix-turn-helix transcriptional regulator n=1 Tax=Streptomyces harbinensis TaxID=1176198 RepID=UPI001591B177|nr:MarR family transcriptional regulator [Streptomyces harbinensis]QKV67334.1 MarR family transcriptional regulator [Streptomyces harbinensis]
MTDLTQVSSTREQRPFGYWLKHIDGAIEENMSRLFAMDGLNRRGWQVLNTISHGPVTVAELDDTMDAFLSADEPTMRPCIDRFAERGWTSTADDGAVTLTEEGRRAHQRVAEQTGVLRDRMMQCLSPQEYRVLMELLQRVATHLDALAVETPGQQPSAPFPSRESGSTGHSRPQSA